MNEKKKEKEKVKEKKRGRTIVRMGEKGSMF